MVHISKSKTGFLVATLSGNQEPLSVSEVLSSKQKCWQNIRAHMLQWDSAVVYIQDDTFKDKSKVYKCILSGKGMSKEFKYVAALGSQYIPIAMRKPKKK